MNGSPLYELYHFPIGTKYINYYRPTQSKHTKLYKLFSIFVFAPLIVLIIFNNGVSMSHL